MSRRAEWLIIVLLTAALAVAAVLGKATAPDSRLRDPRRSTLLPGPSGAKGLADALRRLGVRVELRRRALFDLDADTLPKRPPRLLALLDLAGAPTGPEITALRRFVAGGGRLFVAGAAELARCFGFAVTPVGGSTPDSLPVLPPVEDWRLPATRALLARAEPVLQRRDSAGEGGECAPLPAVGADTLLRTAGGRPVALALSFRGGGRVTLLADAAFVANRALRETDAGLLVLPWFLGGRAGGVTFDEYHQGFGEGGSLFGAAWRWLTEAPGGWAMLQLAVAALLALALLAVRFGPAIGVVERRRRSPLEHLEALASGLERAGGSDTAVALLAAGLRRRLGRSGRAVPQRGDQRRWLASLALAARTEGAERAVRRLAELAEERGGDTQVLATALAVEDVWKALGPEATPRRS